MTRVDEIYDDLELIIAEHKAFHRVFDENIELKCAIEDIKAEINELSKKALRYSDNWDIGRGLDKALEIIDKHISRKEN